MDIASASNFERFMFDQVERDASHLFGLWQRLADTGSFSFSVFLASNDGFDIDSGTATNAEVIDTIKHFYNLHGIVIDPHTAVAVKVAWDHNPSGFGPVVIAETAQPAKFEAAIAEAIGLRMGIPSACKHLLNQQDKYTRIEETDPAAIADAVKNFIETSVG
jgi:threonine synthase